MCGKKSRLTQVTVVPRETVRLSSLKSAISEIRAKGVGVSMGVGVLVRSGASVSVGKSVAVDEDVGVSVGKSVAVGEDVGVAVGKSVAVDEDVGVAVGEFLRAAVGRGVAVACSCKPPPHAPKIIGKSPRRTVTRNSVAIFIIVRWYSPYKPHTIAPLTTAAWIGLIVCLSALPRLPRFPVGTESSTSPWGHIVTHLLLAAMVYLEIGTRPAIRVKRAGAMALAFACFDSVRARG